jgi:monoamine oxidase
LKDGWKTEVGPMRIPHHHRFTHNLVKRFGLKLTPFLNTKADNHYFIGGKKVKQNNLGEVDLKFYQ